MARSIIESVIHHAIKDLRTAAVPNAAPVIALIDDSYNDGLITGDKRTDLIELATTTARQQRSRQQQAAVLAKRMEVQHVR